MSSWIKQQLASTKKIFALTGTAGNAKLLGKTGNVIKAEENARMAEATAQVQAVYDKLSLSAGPISDALNQPRRIWRRAKNHHLRLSSMLSNESGMPLKKLSREHSLQALSESAAHMQAEREHMAKRRAKYGKSPENLAKALSESDQASRETETADPLNRVLPLKPPKVVPEITSTRQAKRASSAIRRSGSRGDSWKRRVTTRPTSTACCSKSAHAYDRQLERSRTEGPRRG